MWDEKSTTNNHRDRLREGYTLIEILVVLALVATVLVITVGMVYGPRRNQKKLLQTGRQFSMDVREAVQESRTRSTALTLEVRNDRYIVYVEDDLPADGYQEDEILIRERRIESGITLTQEPSLPEEWGAGIGRLRVGDFIEFNGMGFARQTVAVFNYSGAPVYQTVCARIYNSGDSDVYRYDPETSVWSQAPLG